MSISEILELTHRAAVPPYSALLLFGSYARGDQDSASDIDIIQVTPVRTKSYTEGKINVTCYTPEQLLGMARGGSMFARHLVMEAVPLVDPAHFVERLRTEYTPPQNYHDVRCEVTCAVPLVAIDGGIFAEGPHYYSATASYLVRTFVYAMAFDAGAQTFAMREVSRVIGDQRPRQYLAELRRTEGYEQFQNVIDLLFELTDTKPFVRKESLEAVVVNSYGSCELAVILGLRILAQGEPVSYAFLRTSI